MQYDVAVVGAGLAGLECAGRVAAAGWRVLILDVKGDVGRGVHTTGILVRRTLEDFAFDEAHLGRPIRRVTLSSPRGRRLELESPRDEFRIGRMGEIYRDRLRRAVALGAEWAPGTRLVSMERSRGRWRLSLREGREARVAAAAVVVGADGARSRVARLAGLPRNERFLAGMEEVLSGVSDAGPPALHCFLDPCLAPGYIGWLASDGRESHIGVAGHAGRFHPVAALGELMERIGRDRDLSAGERVETRGGLIPVGGVLERIAGEDVLLVGDAAGAVSPLTAGGLDPALRLSAFAASVIHARLWTGDPSILRHYDGSRFRRRFRSRLALRAVLSRLERPAASELAVAALRLPGLRSMAGRVFFGRGSFPDPADVGLPAAGDVGDPADDRIGGRTPAARCFCTKLSHLAP